jgi:NADPH:quinone reductase-like Zn-dependent oxidoreductase
MRSESNSMYACVCTHYGPADQVFELKKDVAKPSIPDPYHVLIANKRTAVNPSDCKQRSGNLQLVTKHEFPLILGQDFAGVVVSIGSAVTRVNVGDEVFGSTAPRNSCAAEFVCALEDECAVKPTNISWDQAAATPTAYCTAWKGLFDASYGNLPVYPSYSNNKTRVLIVGASGSVGSAAVQLAIQVAKAEVVAICGAKNADYVKSLGASQVFDYLSSNHEIYFQDNDVSFDLIFDCVGGDTYYHQLYPFLDAKSKTAFYVTCVGPVLHGGSKRITYDTLLNTVGTLVPRFVGNLMPGQFNSRYKMYLSFTTKNKILDQIAKALRDDLIVPRIDPMSPVPLEELGKAHLQVETGHSDGKVVVQV